MEPDGGVTKCPQHRKQALEAMARGREPLPRAVQLFQASSIKTRAATCGSLSTTAAPSLSSPAYGQNWESVRKVKEGPTTNDLFGFLTTEPNNVVGAVHPKAIAGNIARVGAVRGVAFGADRGSVEAAATAYGWGMRVVAVGPQKDETNPVNLQTR